MDIVRNDDGTLVVPVQPERSHAAAEGDGSSDDTDQATQPTTRVLHPGEGGYDEALAEWDLQQNPDRPTAVSTPSGREEAMSVIHSVANSADHAVAPAVADLADPKASGEALRHVLVGGVPSVEAFAAEVADAKGGDPLPAHKATKIIGEVLSVIDS
jgi:hypothetical protein